MGKHFNLFNILMFYKKQQFICIFVYKITVCVCMYLYLCASVCVCMCVPACFVCCVFLFVYEGVYINVRKSVWPYVYVGRVVL